MSDETLRIGLTLSGGGHRAGVFHLGVLARLADGNLLDKVGTVSTVSGGSLVMAVVYAANGNQWPDGADFRKRILPYLRSYYIKRNMEWDFFTKLLRPPTRIFQRRANHLAEALREEWGVRGTLKEIGATPSWVINAVTIESGKNWRFDRQVMGDYKLGYTPSGDFPIAEAVASSAGFPIGIGPLDFASDRYRFIKPRAAAQAKAATPEDKSWGYTLQERFKLDHLSLWDGGLYDNLGLQPVMQHYKAPIDTQLNDEVAKQEFEASKAEGDQRITQIGEEKKQLKDRQQDDPDWLNFLIVSDASPEIKLKPFNPLLSFHRLVTLPADHTRMMYTSQVVNMMRARRNSGAYLQYDNTVGEILRKARERDKMLLKVPQSVIDEISKYSMSEDQVRAAEAYGTRLRKMTPAEFDEIFRHGYEQADVTLYAYNSERGDGFGHIRFRG